MSAAGRFLQGQVPGLYWIPVHAANDLLVVANGSALLMYGVHQPDRVLSSLEFERPEHLLLCERAASMVVVYTVDGVLEVIDLAGTPVLVSDSSHAGIEQLTCSGSEIAYVSSERPMEVTVLQLGVRGEVGYSITATAPVEEDDILASWGTPVDMENATVQSMAFDREFLAVTVNACLQPTARCSTTERRLSNGWQATRSIRLGHFLDHGILAWSVSAIT